MSSKSAAALRPATGDPILSLGASPAVKSGVFRDIAGTVADADAKRQAISDSHKATLEANRAEREKAEKSATEDLPPMREEVESVEFELPDGRVLVMGRPPAGMMTYKLAQVLGDDMQNQVLNSIVRSFLHIRTIDGQAPAVFNSRLEVQKFMDAMGEDAIDLITYVCQTNWRPVSVNELKIVKKTLKTPT